MTRYYLDTNCLISYVTDRNAAQQEKIVDAGHASLGSSVAVSGESPSSISNPSGV